MTNGGELTFAAGRDYSLPHETMDAWAITLLLVFFGSGIGGIGRFLLTEAIGNSCRNRFPFGILLVNVLGAFGIGVFSRFPWEAASVLGGEESRVFFIAGLLGGFTTVSTFSWQTFEMVQKKEWGLAAANVVGNCGFCFGACALGQVLMGAALA